MNRGARLQSARHWLSSQAGRAAERIAKSYRKRYGVDWPCAIAELQSLGIRFDSRWVEHLERTLAGHIQRRAQRRAAGRVRETTGSLAESNEQFAYIAGYTAGGVPFGVTWEEWRQFKSRPAKALEPSADEEIPF
jgi:hypothetical protein